MYQYSFTSAYRLATCHQDLQMIFNTVIEITDIDLGIACGHRSIDEQQKVFKAGKSKLDGINRKSKHNHLPSQAVDIYPFVKGKANWSRENLCYLAGIVKAVSDQFYKSGKITHKIRWGGNWDMDGEILSDQSFDDLPHFELI